MGTKATMGTKAMIGLAAALVFGAAATVPASSKVRVARTAPSHVPPPYYAAREDGRGHSVNPAHDVYVHGRYSGSDPDRRVRGDLGRDPPWGSYSR